MRGLIVKVTRGIFWCRCNVVAAVHGLASRTVPTNPAGLTTCQQASVAKRKTTARYTTVCACQRRCASKKVRHVISICEDAEVPATLLLLGSAHKGCVANRSRLAPFGCRSMMASLLQYPYPARSAIVRSIPFESPVTDGERTVGRISSPWSCMLTFSQACAEWPTRIRPIPIVSHDRRRPGLERL